MTIQKKIRKFYIRKAVDNVFTKIEKHPIMQKDSTVHLDLFDTGIVINLSKTAQKLYPKIAPLLRQLIENRIRKL
jgi:hypothetical protein